MVPSHCGKGREVLGDNLAVLIHRNAFYSFLKNLPKFFSTLEKRVLGGRPLLESLNAFSAKPIFNRFFFFFFF